MDDQVVGAAGTSPKGTDKISDQSDSPAVFLALTLKKYSWPVSSPYVSNLVCPLSTVKVVVEPDGLSKYALSVVYSTS